MQSVMILQVTMVTNWQNKSVRAVAQNPLLQVQ